VDPLGQCKTCVGTARFSAVGPNQATSGGALSSYGISPNNGTLAVNPEIFGLPYQQSAKEYKVRKSWPRRPSRFR